MAGQSLLGPMGKEGETTLGVVVVVEAATGSALPDLGAHLPPSFSFPPHHHRTIPRVFPFMRKPRRSSPSPALLLPAGDHEAKAEEKSKAGPGVSAEPLPEEDS